MATGAGKTFTACMFSWRLLKHANAHRILFLVDRNNLGDQTLKEFQNFDAPGSGRKFTETYIVQHLHGNRIDPGAKVVITTIQRLYAMLRYKELDADLEFNKDQLDRSVTVPAQTRAVLQCYRERLFTDLFPGRTGDWVPKTLISAKDDNHAEEIITIAREVFDTSNDFAKKITYRTADDPKALIKAFRVDPIVGANTGDVCRVDRPVSRHEIVVLLCGGDKRTQQADIDAALELTGQV